MLTVCFLIFLICAVLIIANQIYQCCFVLRRRFNNKWRQPHLTQSKTTSTITADHDHDHDNNEDYKALSSVNVMEKLDYNLIYTITKKLFNNTVDFVGYDNFSRFCEYLEMEDYETYRVAFRKFLGKEFLDKEDMVDKWMEVCEFIDHLQSKIHSKPKPVRSCKKGIKQMYDRFAELRKIHRLFANIAPIIGQNSAVFNEKRPHFYQLMHDCIAYFIKYREEKDVMYNTISELRHHGYFEFIDILDYIDYNAGEYRELLDHFNILEMVMDLQHNISRNKQKLLRKSMKHMKKSLQNLAREGDHGIILNKLENRIMEWMLVGFGKAFLDIVRNYAQEKRNDILRRMKQSFHHDHQMSTSENNHLWTEENLEELYTLKSRDFDAEQLAVETVLIPCLLDDIVPEQEGLVEADADTLKKAKKLNDACQEFILSRNEPFYECGYLSYDDIEDLLDVHLVKLEFQNTQFASDNADLLFAFRDEIDRALMHFNLHHTK